MKDIDKKLQEVAGLKKTLKEIKDAISSNQNVIKTAVQHKLNTPSEFFCPKEMPNSCYLFVEEKKTWAGAQQYCMGKRGHLVAIESWDENNYLKQQITALHTGSLAWWTGGTNDGVAGQWKWKIPNGKDEPMRYHDWDARQPSNSGRKETVVELWSSHHRWNDRVNYVKNYFICEYDKPKNN